MVLDGMTLEDIMRGAMTGHEDEDDWVWRCGVAIGY